MSLLDDDVLDAARESGVGDLSGIRSAVLESFGEISIVPRDDKGYDKCLRNHRFIPLKIWLAKSLT